MPDYRARGLRRRDLSYLKPERFTDYLTVGELSRAVKRDAKYLMRLEQADRIPRALRTRENVRLWSPAQVEEIRAILSRMKVGRPKRDG